MEDNKELKITTCILCQKTFKGITGIKMLNNIKEFTLVHDHLNVRSVRKPLHSHCLIFPRKNQTGTFECKKCGTSFSQKCKHELIHTGNKQFECKMEDNKKLKITTCI